MFGTTSMLLTSALGSCEAANCSSVAPNALELFEIELVPSPSAYGLGRARQQRSVMKSTVISSISITESGSGLGESPYAYIRLRRSRANRLR